VHTQPLREHAAQRSPSHMSGTQCIAIQHGQAVASHVPDRVRMGIEVENAGPTGIPMIEPDHLNSTLDKSTDQRVRPTDTLSSRPRDHQDSGKPRIPDPLGPDPQRARGHEPLVRVQHGRHGSGYLLPNADIYRWPSRSSPGSCRPPRSEQLERGDLNPIDPAV
jgi:hypothetical protein